MKRKKILALALSITMASSMSMTSFAGQWEQAGTDWKYADNGTYLTGWQWIGGKSYYFDGNGIMAKSTVIDGYELNADGQWIVNGVVQIQENATENMSVNHSANYDPAHPLAGMVDAWNLRLRKTNFETGTMGTIDLIANWNVHAMLTNQMDMYENGMIETNYEQTLYNWFCNWLNGMNFRNMSEYQRAQEIKKVIESAEYEVGTGAGSVYAILINKKGQCTDFAIAAKTLSTALGLKCDMKGNANHSWYYIYADGNRYVGSNNGIDLVNPVSDEAFHSGSFDYDESNDFYNRLNDFYNNN